MSTGTADLDRIRDALTEVTAGLTDLSTRLAAGHAESMAPEGFTEFSAELPQSRLERASGLLARTTYRIGFAGAFSAGKSTLVNSLLGEPDLLPTFAGECTMSITVVQPPAEGSQERVEAHYFTREQALRYVLTNSRYLGLLKPHLPKSGEVTPDQIEAAILRGIEDAPRDPNHRGKDRELKEFLEVLKVHAARLGRVHHAPIVEAPLYLTTGKEGSGLGHLLCIEEVHLFRRCRGFGEVGVEIIDLPGTDSVNERQKQLTHQYLSKADAVAILLEPRGISAAGRDIFEEMTKHYHDVKNKLFFVLNRADTWTSDDLKAGSLDRLLKTQVIQKIADFGLDPSRLQLTSALRQDYENRRVAGNLEPEQEAKLRELIADATTKKGRLDPNLDPTIKRLLDPLLADGGVTALRDRLRGYLQREIRLERLREVHRDLDAVHKASARMLDPKNRVIADLRRSTKPYHRQVLDFFDKVRAAVVTEIRDLERGIDKGTQSLVGRTKEEIGRAIEGLRTFRMDPVLRKVGIPNPTQIKVEALAQWRPLLAKRFAETLEQRVATPLIDRIRETLTNSRIVAVLEHFSGPASEDWARTFERFVEEFARVLTQLTRLRTNEATREIVAADLRPAGFEPEWNDGVEKAFKDSVVSLLSERFLGYADDLGRVLPGYYRDLLDGLVGWIERFLDQVADRVRDLPRVSLPAKLLSGDAEDPDARRKLRLLEYVECFEAVDRRHREATALLEAAR